MLETALLRQAASKERAAQTWLLESLDRISDLLARGRAERVRRRENDALPLVLQSPRQLSYGRRLSHTVDAGHHYDKRRIRGCGGAFSFSRQQYGLDLARRARSAGWRSGFYAGANATHIGGASSRHVLDQRIFHVQRSRLLYTRLHLGRRALAAVLGGVDALVDERPGRAAGGD